MGNFLRVILIVLVVIIGFTVFAMTKIFMDGGLIPGGGIWAATYAVASFLPTYLLAKWIWGFKRPPPAGPIHSRNPLHEEGKTIPEPWE